MAPRLSGQMSIFGVVFFVSKSFLGIERQKKLKKFATFTRKPGSHVRMLIYRMWPIAASSNIYLALITVSLQEKAVIQFTDVLEYPSKIGAICFNKSTSSCFGVRHKNYYSDPKVLF